MVRFRSAPATSAALVGVATLVGAASAPRSAGTIDTVSVPSRLATVIAGGKDRTHDHADTIYDFVRQSYDSTSARGPAGTPPVIQALAASRELANGEAAHPTNGRDGEHDGWGDAAPLPFPLRIWTDTVFSGRSTPGTVLDDILRSRNAALFYYGSFSLDEDTREWLAHDPALITVLVERAARFTLIAPALRVSGSSVRTPGGTAAVASWESLVGARATDASGFLQALLLRDEGRLAYFFGAMGQLSDTQLRVGLDLDASPGRRAGAAGRLYRVFLRLTQRWSPDDAPFWRPTLDPAMLLSDLALDESGTPRLPGSAEFWRRLLVGDEPPREAAASGLERLASAGDPVDFATLCELMSERGETAYQRAHHQVLFASRYVARVTPESARDAAEAIRAADSRPALIGTLERLHVRDVSLMARASRRAAEISGIDDEDRASRTLGQFQGALFVLSRAVLGGSLSHEAFQVALDSLLAAPLGAKGDYEGRLVTWLAGVLDAWRSRGHTSPQSSSGAGCRDPFGEDESFDHRLLRLLAGAAPTCPAVEWEGARYRVDLAWAEGNRLLRLLGEPRRLYLEGAGGAARIAANLELGTLPGDDLRREKAALDALAGSAPWEPEIAKALRNVARGLTSRAGARTAAALRLIADDMLARGLAQYAYAASLGQPDRVIVRAGEAAARHEYRTGLPGTLARIGEWRLPIPNVDGPRGWRMSGSLLGLDISLAEFTLVSVSTRPPSQAPTMSDLERRALVEAVALTEPAALDDAEAAALVAAMRRGRARVSTIRTAEAGLLLAAEAGFSQARRTLLAWTVEHEPEQVGVAFAPVDLLRLGLEGAPARAAVAWGAPAAARTGCLCLSLDVPRPWEVLEGRGAMVAGAFPDLKLRLAELLVELDMPARLLAPVLGAATLDLVNTANPVRRHDRHALEAYVGRLRLEDVEQYLALLTTGGPLVPEP